MKILSRSSCYSINIIHLRALKIYGTGDTDAPQFQSRKEEEEDDRGERLSWWGLGRAERGREGFEGFGK